MNLLKLLKSITLWTVFLVALPLILVCYGFYNTVTAITKTCKGIGDDYQDMKSVNELIETVDKTIKENS